MASTTLQVKTEVKDKLNEISLLLVMTSDQDEVGIELLCDLLKDLKTLGQGDPGSARLVAAWSFVDSKRAELNATDFFALLSEFVNSAVSFCENSGSITFANEKSASNSGGGSLDGVDITFLPEFIESHRMQLEDLESWLMNSEFKNEQGEDTDALVKRYIHSLKGDAGSIGLRGVEKTCHYVEDFLASSKVKELTAQILLFREWIVSYLEALTKQQTPTESAEAFMERFSQACGSVKTESSQGTSPAPTAAPVEAAKPTTATGSKEATYTLSGERDIFQEFVAEGEEHLGNVESVVLDAEGTYTKDSIDTIFRGIHSLKGGSAYFNFKEMTETSHLLENLLDEVRSGKRELNQTLTGLVLSYIDLQKNLMAAAKMALGKDCVMTRSPASATFLQALNDYVAGKDSDAPVASAAPAQVSESSAEPSEANSAAKGEKLEVKNFVKVDTLRLDHLIDSIGEMVIYSSMLIRRCRELLPEHEDVQSVTHRVEKFTRDLQDVGMSMRLVPVKGLFQKMSRLVWDTSKKMKKEIAFTMDGEDTELDRNLIDKLADPLMHMVRNALDHGVEPPDDRQKAGKPRAGKVHLSATHSGGCILIKIQDDGRGLDPDKLLSKAKEKGIVAEGQKLSEQEVFQLIFAAGFSTAAVVTDISGRGVGMDVVRRNVESLRGRIHIDSKVGKGTTFTIELPLTLAIVDGIEVAVGDEHLIVPSLAIVEFVKPTAEMLNRTLDQGETLHFRGRYLPIFRVSELYEIAPRYTNPLEATFIVVENHEELIALMVDEIVGELSTVIKSLGNLFSEVKGISGCAVMPNGDVALILDVRSLVLLARAEYEHRPNKSIAVEARA